VARRRRRRRRRRYSRRRRRRRWQASITKRTWSQFGIDPAITYYSTNNDLSIRVESRLRKNPQEVYLELRNQNQNRAWKIGMNDDYNLHIGYGAVGTANGSPDAIRMSRNGNINFYGPVQVKGKMYRKYKAGTGSGVTCIGGYPRVSGMPWYNRGGWTGWSGCPRGYTVTGIQSIHLLDNRAHYLQDIDHYQCHHRGCRAWCRNSRCRVVARCCKTNAAPLRCRAGPYRTQWRNRWGAPSWCPHRWQATGFHNLDLHNNVYYRRQYINDFYVGHRYARAWCYGSNCGVRARCCRPRNWGRNLQCRAGTHAVGYAGRWGPYSKCAPGYAVVSLMRIDLKGPAHHWWYQNMRKYECNNNGCRAFCDGARCSTWAKCCRVVGRRL